MKTTYKSHLAFFHRRLGCLTMKLLALPKILVQNNRKVSITKEICITLGFVPPSSRVVLLGGGLDLASSLEARFGARSPNKRKNLGNSCATRGKNLDRISDFGVISEIQGAKFRVVVTYILEAKFGALTQISETNFGANSPTSTYKSTPPGCHLLPPPPPKKNPNRKPEYNTVPPRCFFFIAFN